MLQRAGSADQLFHGQRTQNRRRRWFPARVNSSSIGCFQLFRGVWPISTTSSPCGLRIAVHCRSAGAPHPAKSSPGNGAISGSARYSASSSAIDGALT